MYKIIQDHLRVCLASSAHDTQARVTKWKTSISVSRQQLTFIKFQILLGLVIQPTLLVNRVRFASKLISGTKCHRCGVKAFCQDRAMSKQEGNPQN